MKNNDKDWGKIIFRIVIVLFIIFFISRWFKLGDSDRDPVQDQTPSIVITENESDVGTEETADTEETVDEPDTGAAEEETADVKVLYGTEPLNPIDGKDELPSAVLRGIARDIRYSLMDDGPHVNQIELQLT